MGLVDSVRAVMWARKRQPDQVAYGVALGHERFGPRELLDQAVAAERAGFDLVCCSDHLAPWWEPAQGPPAHCANAWAPVCTTSRSAGCRSTCRRSTPRRPRSPAG